MNCYSTKLPQVISASCIPQSQIMAATTQSSSWGYPDRLRDASPCLGVSWRRVPRSLLTQRSPDTAILPLHPPPPLGLSMASSVHGGHLPCPGGFELSSLFCIVHQRIIILPGATSWEAWIRKPTGHPRQDDRLLVLTVGKLGSSWSRTREKEVQIKPNATLPELRAAPFLSLLPGIPM